MQDKQYPIGGYAPGNYSCKCCVCGAKFFGDKRAVECEPCAMKDKEAFDSLSPDEQAECIKRNVEAARKLFGNWGKPAASQPPAVKGNEWISASKRLPFAFEGPCLNVVSSQKLHINYTELSGRVIKSTGYFVKDEGEIYCSIDYGPDMLIRADGFDRIKWLDESPPAAGDGKEAMEDIDLIERVLQRWAGKSEVIHTGDGDYEIIVRKKRG